MLGPGVVVYYRVGHLEKRLRLLYIRGNVCENIRWLERSRGCSFLCSGHIGGIFLSLLRLRGSRDFHGE